MAIGHASKTNKLENGKVYDKKLNIVTVFIQRFKSFYLFILQRFLKKSFYDLLLQIQPQKLSEKAFWVNVEEDRLVSPDLLEGLSAKFSSKPPVKKAREGDPDKPMSKKFKELKGKFR